MTYGYKKQQKSQNKNKAQKPLKQFLCFAYLGDTLYSVMLEMTTQDT